MKIPSAARSFLLATPLLLMACLENTQTTPNTEPNNGPNSHDKINPIDVGKAHFAGCGVDESKFRVNGSGLAKQSQYSEPLTGLPSKAVIRDLRIKFDPNFPSATVAAFKKSIEYMNWTYSDFRIRPVTSGENIYVKMQPKGVFANSSACPQQGPYDGCGTWPYMAVPRKGSGAVGDSIWIRYECAFWGDIPPLNTLIIHEIGHCIGMHHTTDGGPLLIAGTPPADEKYSFMGTSPIFWDSTENTAAFWDIGNIFTLNDNRAMQKMFSYSKNETLGDVNGDGKVDILWVNVANNQVSLRLSNGTGLNSTISCGTFGNTEGQYLVGDVTGDKKADLIFVGRDNKIYLRASTGSGFASQTVFGTAFGDPRFGGIYRLLDFNGDGKKDLMFVDFDAASVSVKTSTGTGLSTNTMVRSFGERAGQYFVGDFNGDGKQDIFCAIRPSELPPPSLDHWTKLPHTVRMLLSNGTGFGAESEVICGDCFGNLWRGQYFSGDINGDKKADFVFTGTGDNASASILLSTGSATGQTFPGVGMGSQGVEAQRMSGDFNGDGKMDLIFGSAADNTLRLMTSNGTGFNPPTVIATSSAFGTFTGGQWL